MWDWRGRGGVGGGGKEHTEREWERTGEGGGEEHTDRECELSLIHI